MRSENPASYLRDRNATVVGACTGRSAGLCASVRPIWTATMHPSKGYRRLSDFVAAAKASRDCASAPIASLPHCPPLTVNRNQACTLGCALKKFHTSPASK